jgi:hypothetical protein
MVTSRWRRFHGQTFASTGTLWDGAKRSYHLTISNRAYGRAHNLEPHKTSDSELPLGFPPLHYLVLKMFAVHRASAMTLKRGNMTLGASAKSHISSAMSLKHSAINLSASAKSHLPSAMNLRPRQMTSTHGQTTSTHRQMTSTHRQMTSADGQMTSTHGQMNPRAT